jgi:hypothetical protein
VHEDLERQGGELRWRPARPGWRAISAREFSRASTTSWAAEVAGEFTPAALVTVIWVEAWMGKSGESCRMSRQMPISCTMAASTPAAMIVRR